LASSCTRAGCRQLREAETVRGELETRLLRRSHGLQDWPEAAAADEFGAQPASEQAAGELERHLEAVG
jgi:hypothetical protein